MRRLEHRRARTESVGTYNHFFLLRRSFRQRCEYKSRLQPATHPIMKGATGYEDQGDLKNPVNQVVAILPGEADAAKVVADLHAAGFASDDIGVLSGREDAHKLDAASGRQGWLTKLTQIGPGFGDLDAGNLKDYAEALRHGETVIAVVAVLGNKRREIADLLKQHGAKFINSYGLFSIEGLG
jgi:hypothetical protein